MNENSITQTQKTARLAGFYYLLIVIFSLWGIMYVPSQIYVKDNPTATLQKLLGQEFLFRSGVISQLSNFVVFIFLVMTLYRLFKNTNEHLARLMVVLVIVQVPLVFVAEAFNISALMVAKSQLMASLSQSERADWAYFLLRSNKNVIIVTMIFWGLWLIPFGQLVLKSGYLPKIIGILLILGGIAYVVEIVDYILLSNKLSFITVYTSKLYSIAELSTVAWLLIKGVKTNTN